MFGLRKLRRRVDELETRVERRDQKDRCDHNQHKNDDWEVADWEYAFQHGQHFRIAVPPYTRCKHCYAKMEKPK